MALPEEDFKKQGVCIEKNASSLQANPNWVQWINSIRAYGEMSADLAGEGAVSDFWLLSHALTEFHSVRESTGKGMMERHGD